MLSKTYHFFGKIDAIRQRGLHPSGQQPAWAPEPALWEEPVLRCSRLPQHQALFTLRALHPFKVQIYIAEASSKSFCTSLSY